MSDTSKSHLPVIPGNWGAIAVGTSSIVAGAGGLWLAFSSGNNPDVVEWIVAQGVAVVAGVAVAFIISSSLKKGLIACKKDHAKNRTIRERMRSLEKESQKERPEWFDEGDSTEGAQRQPGIVDKFVQMRFAIVGKDEKKIVEEWCKESRRLGNDERWKTVGDGMARASTVDEMGSILTKNQEFLDDAATRLSQARTMFRLERVATPSQVGDVKKLTKELTDRRRKSLGPVLEELHNVAENMLDRIGSGVWAKTTGIYGIVSVIGFVYLSGYLAYLGVPLRSVLRGGGDLLLIGFMGGAAPVVLFVAYVIYEYLQLRERAATARKDDAKTTVIKPVLTMEAARRARYWAWPCAAAFLFAVNLAVVVAHLESMHGGRYIIRLDGGPTVTARSMGGIGEFTFLDAQRVMGKRPDGYREIVVPTVWIKCITVPRKGGVNEQGSGCRAGRAGREINVLETGAVGQSNSGVEEAGWKEFVERVAHCNPVAIPVGARKYLVSWVFKNGNGYELDMPYYKQHVYGACRRGSGAVGKQDLKKCLTNKLAEFRKNVQMEVKRSRYRGQWSINFIGFASSTGDPPFDEKVAIERADTIMKEMPGYKFATKEGCVRYALDPRLSSDESTNCVPAEYQAWGLAEMPPLGWLGGHGDATQRVVMVAACDRNT